MLLLVVTMYFILESPRWLMVSTVHAPKEGNGANMMSRTMGEPMRRGRFSGGCTNRRVIPRRDSRVREYIQIKAQLEEEKVDHTSPDG